MNKFRARPSAVGAVMARSIKISYRRATCIFDNELTRVAREKCKIIIPNQWNLLT